MQHFTYIYLKYIYLTVNRNTAVKIVLSFNITNYFVKKLSENYHFLFQYICLSYT
jgi:hypothetical protein